MEPAYTSDGRQKEEVKNLSRYTSVTFCVAHPRQKNRFAIYFYNYFYRLVVAGSLSRTGLFFSHPLPLVVKRIGKKMACEPEEILDLK
jgi:hypothetical protein